jgi:adenylate cyclase
MIATLDEVKDFAKGLLHHASEAAQVIKFSMNECSSIKASRAVVEPASLASDPVYGSFDTSYGTMAWAVVLSVDMRGSSKRAIQVGPKHTYLTMHTFLPTMAFLVAKAGGKIIGLRGDGLFAAFGTTPVQTNNFQGVSQDTSDEAIKSATNCGKALVESVDEVINPLLKTSDIDSSVSIGVPIDVGNIVITKIGWSDAVEVTAYGEPINRACKKSITGVWLTNEAKKLFPVSQGGRIKFRNYSDGFMPVYPVDMKMLGGESHRRQRPK